MRRARESRWWLSLGLLLSACGAEELGVVWPDGLELAYLVIVPEEWNGTSASLEVVGPVDAETAPPTKLEVQPGSSVHLISLDRRILADVHPRLSSAGEWRLDPISSELLGDRSCDREGWLHDERELEVSLFVERPGVQGFQLSEDDGTFQTAAAGRLAEALSLRAELDACFGDQRLVLEPFAEPPVDGLEDTSTYAQIQYLDDDTIMAISGYYLRIVRRGAPDPAERQLTAQELGLEVPASGLSWLITAAVLRGNGERAVGILGASLMPVAGGPTVGGALLELSLSPTDIRAGMVLYRTEIPTREQTARFGKIAMDESGRWVSVGEGLVVSATSTRGRLEVIEQSSSFDPFDVRSTGLDQRPFIIVGKNLLLWGSPFSGLAGLEDFPLSEGATTNRRNAAMDVALDGEELVVDLLKTTVELSRGRSGGLGWEDRPVRVNAAPVLCRHDWSCGRPSAALPGQVLTKAPTALGDATYVAPEACNTLYLIDRRDDCAISADIPLEGTIVDGARDKAELYQGARRGGRVLFGGQRGRLLEARVEP